ncbi:hypothetical protein E2C01_076270 [Portunus trituberculatus]|uniref:Uncharacterized protein n=1 Tax=Portunus trituberculatus TaxID=210409 RepID=A0A5B7ICU0_PORTR|nr:hypothetical protein [Portunus trituberculatus]
MKRLITLLLNRGVIKVSSPRYVLRGAKVNENPMSPSPEINAVFRLCNSLGSEVLSTLLAL